MQNNAKNIWSRMGMGIGVLCLLSFSSCGEAENSGEIGTETTGTDTEATGETEVADDGLFDSNEFYTSFNSNNLFEDWDLNDDNFLDENEFDESNYGIWDTDNDGILEENEWNDDVSNFGLTGETWDSWDANNDNQVDKNEFNSALDDNNYYSTWDADKNNQLTEREYTDGIFSLWDDNDDGQVEKERYSNYYNTYFGV